MVCKESFTWLEYYCFLSFILTMWYVKLLVDADLDDIDTGFILTMWYVKFTDEQIRTIKDKGFILTMWYVKFSKVTVVALKVYSFYINYVVCKVSLSLKNLNITS